MGRERDLRLEQHWRRHLERQRNSGLSVRAYCAKAGVGEAAFHNWRRVIAERDRESPAFVPVVIADDSTLNSDTPIEIRLANGRRLRVRAGCDRTLLAEIVTLLEARPC